MLYDQPGPIRAYKLVNEQAEGPVYGSLKYEVGKTVRVPVKDVSADPLLDCGPGINLGSFVWCASEWRPGYRILVCEFDVADLVCVPIGGGKFRVSKCTVIGEKDLAEVGLVPVKVEETG